MASRLYWSCPPTQPTTRGRTRTINSTQISPGAMKARTYGHQVPSSSAARAGEARLGSLATGAALLRRLHSVVVGDDEGLALAAPAPYAAPPPHLEVGARQD